MRNLVLILGDQLDHNISSLKNFDKESDSIWMAECENELTHVWTHKVKLCLFLSAMRHFKDELKDKGYTVHYHQITKKPSKDRGASFSEILKEDLKRFSPEKLILTESGEYRVEEELRGLASDLECELEIVPDTHFYCSKSEFESWAKGRNSLVMEYFYREIRKKNKILMTEDGQPEGGDWNFDSDNRETFTKTGPPEHKRVRSFQNDDITKEVISLVQERYAEHPGTLDHFDYPVTHKQALEAVNDFVEHRLSLFGKYQDAMWGEESFLFHSRISSALNMHLVNPRYVVDKVVAAYEANKVPINSAEGFIRQVIGWREFVRGIYFKFMPEYIEKNALRCADTDVPKSMWNGDTDMNCIRQSMKTVVSYAYSHHIQRLMVLGLFSQLLGVHPRKFHDWHMAMYADAIDWVSLPNTLGMSQFGDGGVVGTKPYCASGNYVNKMSNYCKSCRFNYKKSSGEDACPMTVLYWDFLDRHKKMFGSNPRMKFQMKNLERKKDSDMQEIRAVAKEIKEKYL